MARCTSWCNSYSPLIGILVLVYYIFDLASDAFVLVPFIQNLFAPCVDQQFTGACNRLERYVCEPVKYSSSGAFRSFWFDTAPQCPVNVVRGLQAGEYNASSQLFAPEIYTVLSFDGFGISGIFCMDFVNVTFDPQFGSFSGHPIGNCTLVGTSIVDICTAEYNFTADDFLPSPVCSSSDWLLLKVLTGICTLTLIATVVLTIYGAITKRYGQTTLLGILERLCIGSGLWKIDKEEYEGSIDPATGGPKDGVSGILMLVLESTLEVTNIVLAIFLLSPYIDTANATSNFNFQFLEGQSSQTYVSPTELVTTLLLSVSTSYIAGNLILLRFIYMKLLQTNRIVALSVVLATYISTTALLVTLLPRPTVNKIGDVLQSYGFVAIAAIAVLVYIVYLHYSNRQDDASRDDKDKETSALGIQSGKEET